MATLKRCSVADVTLRLKATQAQATGLSDAVWYGGSWFGVNGAMYFRVVGDGATQGLLYWDPAHAEYFWNNYEVTTSGAGTLVQAFSGGELDVELRFRTVIDGGGAHYAEAYCDDVLVDTRVTSGAPAIEELLSALWISGGGKNIAGAGFETYRVGGPAATVWQMHLAGTWKVIVGEDGQPAVIVNVAHAWAAWQAYIAAGGDAADYRLAGDLFAEGFWQWNRLAVDGEACLYDLSQAGDGFLDLLQATFRQYCQGGAPNLSLTHHTVSNALLVTDAGLASDGSVGHHKIQRK